MKHSLTLGLLIFASLGGFADSDAAGEPPVSVAPDSVGTIASIESSNQHDDIREQAALSPDEPYWPFHLGELYLQENAVSQAETELKNSLARDSLYAPALSLLSKVYFAEARHQEAIAMLEPVRHRFDEIEGGMPSELLVGLALHYDAVDQIEMARDAMDQLVRQKVDQLGSSMVYLTLRGEEPALATDLAETTLKKDAKSAVNQNNYGITRLRAGDLTSAREAFLAAIELDPRLAGPYYNLAILEKFYELDDQAAAEWFRLYGKRSVEDPDGLFEVFGGGGEQAMTKGKD